MKRVCVVAVDCRHEAECLTTRAAAKPVNVIESMRRKSGAVMCRDRKSVINTAARKHLSEVVSVCGLEASWLAK